MSRLNTPQVFSFSFIFRDKGISAIYADFITSLSMLKGSVDIN